MNRYQLLTAVFKVSVLGEVGYQQVESFCNDPSHPNSIVSAATVLTLLGIEIFETARMIERHLRRKRRNPERSASLSSPPLAALAIVMSGSISISMLLIALHFPAEGSFKRTVIPSQGQVCTHEG